MSDASNPSRLSWRERFAVALDRPLVASILFALTTILIVGSAIGPLQGTGLVAAALIILLILVVRPRGFRNIGFVRPGSWPKTVALALALGLAIEIISDVLMLPLLESATGTSIDLSQFTDLEGNLSALLAWLFFVWAAVVFLEEIVFRGFMMNLVWRIVGDTKAGTIIAVVATSIVFGLAHWYQDLPGVILTGSLGAALALCYLWTGRNIWLPILVHGVINTSAFLLMYLGIYDEFTELVFG